MRKINIREEICYCITAYLNWVCQNSTYLNSMDPAIRGMDLVLGGYGPGISGMDSAIRGMDSAIRGMDPAIRDIYGPGN
jgi:hypothetical protein